MTVGNLLRAALPALSAVMMGIGLARFSFSPVAAALVDQRILTSVDVTRIGAVMLASYLIGALAAEPLARRVGVAVLMRAALLGCVTVLAVEGFLASPWLIALTRGVAGALGAVLMILGPTSALRSVPASQRPTASAVAFTGIGIGTILSGWSVVATIPYGPAATSLAIGVIALATTAVGWWGWPRRLPAPPPVHRPGRRMPALRPALVVLAVLWASDAFGYIPHSVYLSEYASSELGLGVTVAGVLFSAFGFGCVAGPFAAAFLFRALGGKMALITTLALKGMMVVAVILVPSKAVLFASAFVVGAFSPGMGVLITTELTRHVEAASLSRVWGYMTALFAVAQGVGGALASAVYSDVHSYEPLFLGAGLILIAAAGAGILLPRTASSAQCRESAGA